VQVPLELPVPDRFALSRLLLERLDFIVANSPVDLFNQTYWDNVYHEGIKHFITTPRDAVRLTNSLSVTFPAVNGEVNTVDFIAIETIRIFCPEAYDKIRNNSSYFSGYLIQSTFSSQLEELKSFHEPWISKIGERDKEPLKRIIMLLFPKLELIWGRATYNSELASEWRKQLRICSPGFFDVYFRFCILEHGISNAEMKQVLDLTQDRTAFEKKLLQLAEQKRPDGISKVRVLLEKLRDYTEKDIPTESIQPIICSFFNIGDRLLLPEDEEQRLLDYGNDTRIGKIIWQLLHRLDETERFELLKSSISSGQAISIIVNEITTFGIQHGKYGSEKNYSESDKLVNKGQLESLEKLALERIRIKAQNFSLLEAPKLPDILYRWCDWTNEEEEVNHWIGLIANTDDDLVRFLEKFVVKSRNYNLGGKIIKVEYRLNPKNLETFIDIAQVFERVSKMSKYDNLTDRQKIAIECFIREYNMIQQELNPDSPFDRRTFNTE
jgi:predicted KAP-like P-loop ATPase